MMQGAYTIPSNNRFEKYFLAAGVIGIVISIIGIFINRSYFYHSYLISFAFWLTLALGGLFFTMLHHLVSATWSVVFRRLSENIMSTLIFLAVFIVPVIFGINDLYHWSHKDLIAQDIVLRGKALYLNTGFFIIRAIIYLGIWLFLAWKLYNLSIRQDKGEGDDQIARMRKVSAAGMVLFAFTLTFAAFDWFMSLEAYWYSTIFGVYIFAGAVLSVLCFITLNTVYLKKKGIFSEAVTAEHFHDLGKLTFTFVVFWGYIAFAQYFLIWYGNIPEETVWYHARWDGIWHYVSLLLVFGNFVIPFVVLITRSAKRNMSIMRFMAVWLLLMHWADLYWLIMPSYKNSTFSYLWIDLGTMLAIGGLFLWYFWRKQVSQPVLPINDPSLEASFNLISD
jgi:hypothetical protein